MKEHENTMEETNHTTITNLNLSHLESPPSQDLFKHGGKYLPSVLPIDESQEWFYTDTFYPLYHKLFCHILTQPHFRSRPIHLFEIGVRTGYIPIVFQRALAASSCSGFYTGLDLETYEANGLALTAKSLDKIGLPYILLKGNSTTYNFNRYRNKVDILHIDGEHTRAAKLSDLRNGFEMVRPGGYILVDDYDHHIVKAAIHEWIEEMEREKDTPDTLFTVAHLKTYRGLIVIRKKNNLTTKQNGTK